MPPDPAGPTAPLDGERTRQHLRTTVYEQLRAIAQHQMNAERAGHTLSATALVHEAFMRMAPELAKTADRAEFYRSAALAMRRILVDHARRRGAIKRGGDRKRAPEIQTVLDLARDDLLGEALALDDAIVRLEKEDAEAAEVVRLRFFAGLTGDQTAGVMEISPRQVDRAWAFARAFLFREMGGAAS
jgi:RNA polymerase sigma factor (TIGR02999 family)